MFRREGKKKAKNENSQMAFLDHLEEIRKRLLIVLGIFVVAFGSFYPFHDWLLGLLPGPWIIRNLFSLILPSPF